MSEVEFDRKGTVLTNMNKANSLITYTNIHGKNYADVKERIRAFRSVYPEGAISTKIIELDDQHCVVKADIFNENGSLLATGTAQERIATTKFKDKVVEVAETSAIGRALGVAGFGIEGGVASAQDMERFNERNDDYQKGMMCHRCGRKITDCADKDGVVWRAEKIAQETLKAYGDAFCLSCVAEIKRNKTEMEGAR